MSQIYLDVGKVIMGDNSNEVVANMTFFSTQQRISSQIASLINFENLYNWIVHFVAKEIIRNWIDLKILVHKLSYHLWKDLSWFFRLSNWIGNTWLTSNFSNVIDVQILVGLLINVFLRMWMRNVLTQFLSSCMYSHFVI